jgi:hypothetical protein
MYRERAEVVAARDVEAAIRDGAGELLICGEDDPDAVGVRHAGGAPLTLRHSIWPPESGVGGRRTAPAPDEVDTICRVVTEACWRLLGANSRGRSRG